MSSENRAAVRSAVIFPAGWKNSSPHERAALELGMLTESLRRADRAVARQRLHRRGSGAARAGEPRYPLIREFSTTKSAQVHAATAGKCSVSAIPMGWSAIRMADRRLQDRLHLQSRACCLVMHARINERPIVIVLLDSWGKYTRIGDANRIKKWLESGALRWRTPADRSAPSQETYRKERSRFRGTARVLRESRAPQHVRRTRRS